MSKCYFLDNNEIDQIKQQIIQLQQRLSKLESPPKQGQLWGNKEGNRMVIWKVDGDWVEYSNEACGIDIIIKDHCEPAINVKALKTSNNWDGYNNLTKDKVYDAVDKGNYYYYRGDDGKMWSARKSNFTIVNDDNMSKEPLKIVDEFKAQKQLDSLKTSEIEVGQVWENIKGNRLLIVDCRKPQYISERAKDSRITWETELKKNYTIIGKSDLFLRSK